MNRRTVLQRTGIAAAAVTGLAGCSGTEGDDGETEPLPELTLSGQQLESSVDGLVITGSDVDLRRGQQHDDVHFAVTATVENIGDQSVNLGDYTYEITLLSPEDIDITPGNTWAARPDEVAPGETGTVLLQVSFISAEGVDPEDVDRYEVTLSCGEGASYCQ
jgi:hypothetical protein